IAEAIVLVTARARARQVLATLALPLVLTAPVWAAGALIAHRGPLGGFAARPVAVVQTNLPPAFEWTRAYTDREVMAHLQATDRLPLTSRPALIVWPEHAVPRYLEDEPMLGAQLGAVAAQRGADLLFGAPRYEAGRTRSEEHTSELQSRSDLVCRLLLEKKNVVLIAKSARCALT